jgi:hypothetical protein
MIGILRGGPIAFRPRARAAAAAAAAAVLAAPLAGPAVSADAVHAPAAGG